MRATQIDPFKAVGVRLLAVVFVSFNPLLPQSNLSCRPRTPETTAQ